MTTALSPYERLKNDILAVKNETESKVNNVLILGYWKIGKRITEEESGERFLQSLAIDLGIEATNLGRAVVFFQLFPHVAPIDTYPNLTWSHYRLALPIRDEKKRVALLAQANEKQWSVRVLQSKIKENENLLSDASSSLCNDGRQLKRSTKRLHLYKATIERVVDGDTLLVNIDLGFDVWTTKRLRLRGIDTPEKKTPEGEAAHLFTQECLPPNTTVVIQTFTVDLHGRYVVDVFFLLGETDKEKIFAEGRFLNQVLLDEGHAELM